MPAMVSPPGFVTATVLLGLIAGISTSAEAPGILLLGGSPTPERAARGSVADHSPPGTSDARRQALIDAVRGWEYGTDRRPLLELQAAVQATEPDPEERSAWAQALARALQEPGTPEGRAALCEPLGWVGSDGEVGALAPLLRVEGLSLAARGALEAMASPGARGALRGAVRDVPYPQRAGLLQSLGRLGDTEALPLMVEEWSAGSPAARQAALEGMALLATAPACGHLVDWEAEVPPDLRTSWADAVLDCLEDPDAPTAAPSLRERLAGPSYPDHIRRSALALQIASIPPKDRPALLLRHLAADDEVRRRAALQAIRAAAPPDPLSESLAPQLVALPPSVQVPLIPLLARSPSPPILASLHGALEAGDPAVRAAAATALADSSDPQSAREMLARLSREPDLGVRSALIEGLSRIPAPGTDDRLVQALRGSTHVPQGLLVEIVVARQAAGATPVLLDLAAGDDPELARDALRALGELGDPDTGRALVELMGPATPEGIARSSLVRIARRLEPPRVDWLLSDWDTRPPGVQAALMPVLSAVGGEDALTAVRGGLASESPEVRAAALRALGDWPDSAAAPDLLGVARSSANEEEVRRALAGWTRVLGAEGAGPSEASWREAFSLASRPEERKALLGALVRAPRPGLRDQVLGLRDDPELSEEATLALAAMARDPATDPPVQLELWRALYASDAADELRNEALEARVGAGDEARLTAPDGVSRRWRRDGESLALEEDGQVLWAFEFGPERTKPFFHPLAQPGTAPVTARSPADHPWHYGLWFSWKYVNGVNYWEEDRETGRAAGTTSWTPPRIALRHDGSARVELDLRYQPAGGHPVLREARTIEVSPPRGDGAYALDWSLTFTALTEVVLDRTPLPTEPDGQVWGGYAGLSARLSTELTERKTSLTAGEPRWVDDRIRLRAEAVDYSGVVEGRRLGLAILDHPLNLNAPTPWYAIQSEEMSFFSPAVICFGAHRLGAGESLTLRYRVWVHPGAWPGDRLRRAYREYTDE